VSGTGGEETWRLLATSFEALQFALRIFHYRWHKCTQLITGLHESADRLGSFCAVFERVLVDRLLAHLTKYNILTDEQY
jgi:hypothetical protein